MNTMRVRDAMLRKPCILAGLLCVGFALLYLGLPTSGGYFTRDPLLYYANIEVRARE